MPPVARPYCAEKLLVMTLNSWTESSGTSWPTVASNSSLLAEPSSRTLVLAERMPLMANPVPRFDWSSGVTLPATATRSYTFRVIVGSSRICASLMVVATSAVTVLTSSEPATTLTTSVRPPTSRRALTLAAAPTGTTIFVDQLRNPWSATVSSYVVGATFAKRYAPLPSVTVSRVVPAPTFFSVTLAPGSTPPEVSVTTPDTRPVSVCAQAGTAIKSPTIASNIAWNRIDCLVPSGSATKGIADITFPPVKYENYPRHGQCDRRSRRATTSKNSTRLLVTKTRLLGPNCRIFPVNIRN